MSGRAAGTSGISESRAESGREAAVGGDGIPAENGCQRGGNVIDFFGETVAAWQLLPFSGSTQCGRRERSGGVAVPGDGFSRGIGDAVIQEGLEKQRRPRTADLPAETARLVTFAYHCSEFLVALLREQALANDFRALREFGAGEDLQVRPCPVRAHDLSRRLALEADIDARESSVVAEQPSHTDHGPGKG